VNRRAFPAAAMQIARAVGGLESLVAGIEAVLTVMPENPKSTTCRP